jgi:hypothetical protein
MGLVGLVLRGRGLVGLVGWGVLVGGAVFLPLGDLLPWCLSQPPLFPPPPSLSNGPCNLLPTPPSLFVIPFNHTHIPTRPPPPPASFSWPPGGCVGAGHHRHRDGGVHPAPLGRPPAARHLHDQPGGAPHPGGEGALEPRLP